MSSRPYRLSQLACTSCGVLFIPCQQYRHVINNHLPRQQQQAEGKAFGKSVVAVGCVATAYHASSGRVRVWLRKADYWCISWATSRLLRALHPGSRAVQRATSLVLPAVPFQPFAISAANICAAEVEFVRMASRDEQQAASVTRHAASLAAGLACFALEDIALERGVVIVHAAWHLLACMALFETGGLLRCRSNALMLRKA